MSNQQVGKAGSSGSVVVGLVLLFACAAFGFSRLSGTLGLTPNTSPPAASPSVPVPQREALPQISNPAGMSIPPDLAPEEIVELFQHELVHLMPDMSER